MTVNVLVIGLVTQWVSFAGVWLNIVKKEGANARCLRDCEKTGIIEGYIGTCAVYSNVPKSDLHFVCWGTLWNYGSHRLSAPGLVGVVHDVGCSIVIYCWVRPVFSFLWWYCCLKMFKTSDGSMRWWRPCWKEALNCCLCEELIGWFVLDILLSSASISIIGVGDRLLSLSCWSRVGFSANLSSAGRHMKLEQVWRSSASFAFELGIVLIWLKQQSHSEGFEISCFSVSCGFWLIFHRMCSHESEEDFFLINYCCSISCLERHHTLMIRVCAVDQRFLQKACFCIRDDQACGSRKSVAA